MTAFSGREDGRSIKILFWVSTLLIILIGCVFILKNILGNPLLGRWRSSDEKYYLEIKEDREALAGTVDPELTEKEMTLSYVVYKKEKVVVFSHTGDFAGSERETDGASTETADDFFFNITAGFDYSIDRNRLTLTDREYGSQMKFVKE